MARSISATEVRRELAERGIRSERQMYEKLPNETKRIRLYGVWLIEERGVVSAVPLLVQLLADEDEDVRMAAAAALTKGGRSALLALVGLLQIEQRRSVRHAAVYSLAFLFDEQASGLLLSIFENRDEAPGTRAIAAEGIANLLEHVHPQSTIYKHAVAHLIGGLHDRSPQVRFWATFALGRLKARQAVPHLERLAETDSAVCRGWWSVAREAKDALLSISGEEPPDRVAEGDEYS